MLLGPFYITTKRKREAELEARKAQDALRTKMFSQLLGDNYILRRQVERWGIAEGVLRTG